VEHRYVAAGATASETAIEEADAITIAFAEGLDRYCVLYAPSRSIRVGLQLSSWKKKGL